MPKLLLPNIIDYERYDFLKKQIRNLEKITGEYICLNFECISLKFKNESLNEEYKDLIEALQNEYLACTDKTRPVLEIARFE